MSLGGRGLLTTHTVIWSLERYRPIQIPIVGTRALVQIAPSSQTRHRLTTERGMIHHRILADPWIPRVLWLQIIASRSPLLVSHQSSVSNTLFDVLGYV